MWAGYAERNWCEKTDAFLMRWCRADIIVYSIRNPQSATRNPRADTGVSGGGGGNAAEGSWGFRAGQGGRIASDLIDVQQAEQRCGNRTPRVRRDDLVVDRVDRHLGDVLFDLAN